jgi:ubiquinol-cytochrome c reductase iron-sulfur subunit
VTLPEGRDAARWIGLAFGTSTLASVGLAVVYFLGGQPQLEGALLGVALGAIAVGLSLWAKKLLPTGPFVEARDFVPHQAEARPEAEAAFESGAAVMERRSFLVKMLVAALGALGLAALFPIRSLGTRPGRSLFSTAWSEGARLVTRTGLAVGPGDLEVGGVLTVFPENHTDAADAQTLLIRLDPGVYEPPPGREDWVPEGFIAFSKVCPHAGCPVGLYQPETKELFCPCHQSVFDVLNSAAPTGGPATRPLPQLPLAIDLDGYFVAQGDFPEPVGPGYWDRGRD